MGAHQNQTSFYWKKVRISLFKLSCLYLQKKKDLKITDIEYNPKGEKCELCDHYPINNIFILENTVSKEKKRIGSECAVNFVDEKFLLSASGLLRSEVFKDKYKDTIKEINQYPYKTKPMRTFLENIEKGNYPWATLMVKLNKDFQEISPHNHKQVEKFVEEHPDRWLTKEISAELKRGNYPTAWQVKEMGRIQAKENEKKLKAKTRAPKRVKEIITQPSDNGNPCGEINKLGLPSKQALEKMSLKEKLNLLGN